MIDGRAEICYSPLKDCTLDELNAYEFPDPDRISRQKLEQWAKDAEWLHTQTEYAVIAEHPVLGVFELGCWMFGFDDYLYRLLAEPEIVHAFSKDGLHIRKKLSGNITAQLARISTRLHPAMILERRKHNLCLLRRLTK